MSVFNIYLGNPTGMRYDWDALCVAVRDVFAPALQEHRRFSGVYVQSTMQRPSLAPAELLVYVVPTSRSSVVRRLGNEPTSAGGLTTMVQHHPRYGTCTGSEVYAQGKTLNVLAKVIFHEALHNKTGWSNERLHSQGGLATSPLGESDQLSPANTRLMRRHIADAVPQWLDGFPTAPSR